MGPSHFRALLASVSALPLFALTAAPAAAQEKVSGETQQNVAVTAVMDASASQDVSAPQANVQATAPAAGEAPNNIVIVGRRGSIERAAELERKSDVLKSIVTADDIGQFGDPTVAESLQRISGVSINREGGEGQQVSIRGLPTEFATVTVDGARLGTTDPDINSTKLDFFSADNLSQIEVTKALTPEQDADAIAGSINLKSNSAFRRGKNSFGGRAEMKYNERRKSWNPKVSADFTRIFPLANGNRVGLAASVTWSKEKLFNDDVRADDGLEFVVNNRSLTSPRYTIANSCSGAGVVECFLRPQQYDIRAQFQDIDRLSLNSTLEFQLGNNLLEFRGTYSRANSEKLTDRTTFSMERSNNADIITMTPTSGVLNNARSERRILPGHGKNPVYTLGFDGTTTPGDWKVTYGGYYSHNEETVDQIEGRFRVDRVRLTYENMGPFGIDTVLSQQASNRPNPAIASSYTLVSNRVNQRLQNSVDKNWSAYTNVERLFSLFNNEASFKVGAKYRSRSRDFNFDRLEVDVGPGVDLGDFAPLNDRIELSRLPILLDPADHAEFERRIRELRAGGTVLSPIVVGNSTALLSVVQDYTAKEDISAAYAQVTVHPAESVQIIGGVRAEHTKYSSTGNRFRELAFNDLATTQLTTALAAGGVSAATIADFKLSRTAILPVEPFEGGNKYTDILPSLNIKWQPTRDWVVRASYAKGLKRPEFGEAAAVQDFVTTENGLSEIILANVISTTYGGRLTSIAQANAAIAAAVAQGGQPQFVTEGNSLRDPNLKELTSHNFDASVAWYPSRNTTFSVSAFYKKIKNFIFPVGLAGQAVQDLGYPPDTGTATTFGVDRINTFINGNKAKIYGVEFAFYQAFRFLPKPLDGFYLEGNVTFAKSKASAPLVDRTFPFPDQSNRIGNLSVGYENKLFSLRAAAVYQGPRLRVLNYGQLRDSNDPAGDFLEAKRTQVDISARFNVTKDIQLYFDAINITKAGDRRFYRGIPEGLGIVGRNEQYGVSYQGGVRARF